MLVKQHNKKEKQIPMKLPELKIVLTLTEYVYKRHNGIFVIPLGCLKN